MKKDFLINTSGFVLNIIEKILNTHIQVKGVENIPKDTPIIFVANHFTRIEAMLVPYALYDITKKKVGVIADDSLFKSYFGNFLRDLGAMPKSNPLRNNIIIGDLLTGEKDWLIFPEGKMVKAKDITKDGNHYCVKIDGACQRVHTGSAFFALYSQLLRKDYFSKKIRNKVKFQRKYLIKDCHDIKSTETMIVPINITYSKLRTGENFLTNMARGFLDKSTAGEHFFEELELEGNIVLNSKINIQILEAVSIKNVLNHYYKNEPNHKKITNSYRYELTHYFMTQVYEHLAVNFDHVFALVLYLLPRDKVEKNHFKRLIYLAIDLVKTNAKALDEDLEKNELIKLVSLQNYEPFEDILALAMKDKIIEEGETDYYINKELLLESYTHHTIRLKNILKVILNEILVIDKVSEAVKKLMAFTHEEINKKLLELLKREESYEYQNDYNKYKNDEDVKPKEVGISYSYENRKKDTGVIVLHGFSSSPKEVEPLAKYLHDKGLNVHAPRLRGHGTSPKDLKNTKWQEWYLSLCRAIAITTLKYKKIYIIGFSTGGLLALLSAKKSNANIRGVICINAALHLNDIRMNTVFPAVSFWNDVVGAVHMQNYLKEYIDSNCENSKLNYNKHYIDAIKQLSLLMNKTINSLYEVTIPIFIIQAKNDPVVNPSSAYEIYDKIQSKDKEILMLDLDKHIIIQDKNTKELFDSIFTFVNKSH